MGGRRSDNCTHHKLGSSGDTRGLSRQSDFMSEDEVIKSHGRLRDQTEMQFEPIGSCIYCGASGVNLTREHVVPLGMHGEMVLPKASCDQCAKITGQLETFVLGRSLIALRIRYGLKSRKKAKNKRPTSFDITVENVFTKAKRHKNVSNDYLPWLSYSMPISDFPGLLLQISGEESGLSRKLDWAISKFDAENRLGLGDGSEIVGSNEGVHNHAIFYRFLAKIAHSYLVATLGLENFTPILTKLILEGHDHPTFWVGCDEKEPPAPFLFEVSHGDCEITHGPFQGKKYITVRIRLFSFIGTPTYVVAAGEYRCSEQWLFEQPCYALPAKVLIKDPDGQPLYSVGV